MAKSKLLIATFLSLVGCGGSTSSMSDLAGDDFAGSANVDLATSSSGGVSLTGTWAAKNVDSQIFSGPLGADTVTIMSLSRTEMIQTGTTVSTKTQVCSITLTPYKTSQTAYPAAAVAAFTVEASTATLSADAVGAKYLPVKRIQLSGWTSTGNAETDALPTADTDLRVKDTDGDGHPGVTLQVTGFPVGDIYVAARSTFETSATVASHDLIVGPSTSHLEQKVLGSTNTLLNSSAVTSTPNPAAGSSNYTMVRVASGSDTCAQIIANAGPLFP